MIPELDILTLEKLYKKFGSGEAIWNANLTELKEIVLKQRENINLEEEFKKLENKGIKILSLNNPNYPRLLLETPHPPLALYYKGSPVDADFQNPNKISIVGTRKATAYGLKTARNLSRDLSFCGVCVVSGLAFGIDAEAHRGALEGDTPTWAVLGSGLNNIYPSSHKFLAEKILEKGGIIISEYPPDAHPTKWTFPERNRIIAGLTRATIVVEAPKKSGSLITVNFALDYNREVGAIPGEIDSLNSEGANYLIKNGAAIIRNSSDALELLGIQKEGAMSQKIDSLDKTDILIINSLKKPKNIDELIEAANLSVSELNQRITFLELSGLIKNTNGFYETITS